MLASQIENKAEEIKKMGIKSDLGLKSLDLFHEEFGKREAPARRVNGSGSGRYGNYQTRTRLILLVLDPAHLPTGPKLLFPYPSI